MTPTFQVFLRFGKIAAYMAIWEVT